AGRLALVVAVEFLAELALRADLDDAAAFLPARGDIDEQDVLVLLAPIPRQDILNDEVALGERQPQQGFQAGLILAPVFRVGDGHRFLQPAPRLARPLPGAAALRRPGVLRTRQGIALAAHGLSSPRTDISSKN